jgi:hypothetical protein
MNFHNGIPNMQGSMKHDDVGSLKERRPTGIIQQPATAQESIVLSYGGWWLLSYKMQKLGHVA